LQHVRQAALRPPIEKARALAPQAASYHGPVLKVSEDGFVTMFLGGRRVWEM
jgi:hypothetical protein